MNRFTALSFPRLREQHHGQARAPSCESAGIKAFLVAAKGRLGYVNVNSEWHLEHLRFDKRVAFDRGRFGFDLDGYVEAYLSKNGCLARREEFSRQVKAVELPDGLDRRCFIHGNDFLSLLRRMLNKLRRKSVYGSEEVVFTLLRACANYASLAEEPMFATILRRFE
jgi:hypothetical protein